MEKGKGRGGRVVRKRRMKGRGEGLGVWVRGSGEMLRVVKKVQQFLATSW